MAKTLKVNTKDVPFDDSAAIIRSVDIITENMSTDGAVHLGVGSLVGLLETHHVEVQGVIHLRMTPKFARTLAARLLSSASLADEQIKEEWKARTTKARDAN
jgi:hypothetical protein